MKRMRTILTTLAVILSAWVMPAFAQDFIGKWDVVTKHELMGEMKSVMTISKDADGNYQVDMGNAGAEIKDISVNQQTMTINVSAMGMSFPIQLTMKDDDTLEGVIEVADNVLTIKATRVKPEN